MNTLNRDESVTSGTVPRNWHSAKRAMRKQHRKYAKRILQSIAGKQQYVKWAADKKVDFVLVYRPRVEYLDRESGTVAPDPRPMDRDDLAELTLPDGDHNSRLRVEYINQLRISGLEVEIENFTSKFEEYRAIKICGTDFAMNTWAEKFRLMKPVKPPLDEMVSGWKTEEKLHHRLGEEGGDIYTRQLHPDKDEVESGEEVGCGPGALPGPTSEGAVKEKPALYPSLSGFMRGTTNWGKIRAVLDVTHDKPVDKLIAMYNETLYKIETHDDDDDDDDDDDKQVFDGSKYVPETLLSAMRGMRSAVGRTLTLGRMRPQSSKSYDMEMREDEPEARPPKKEKKNYEKSEAFIQLTFQNERYGSLWSTRVQNWVFDIVHRGDERLSLAKDNLVSRAIRAPFNCDKEEKFLGHDEPEFYNSSERSLMVFRILEEVQVKLATEERVSRARGILKKKKKKEKRGKLEREIETHQLKDMYRSGCFEAAYPLHSGGYKYKQGQTKTQWSDIDILDIDNPRKLLRYFWSSSHMKWKFQPLNIVRNYFGSVTAMYFAYFGFYNLSLVFPAVFGSVVFFYGIVQMFFAESVQQICDSGTKYLMCKGCHIDGQCDPSYLSDYCFTTRITSAANNGAVIVFSIFMMLWMALFVSFWKREQHTTAHTWGTTNSRSASAEVRTKYTLTKTEEFRFNVVTGRREQHVTFLRRLPQYIIAFTVVAIFLAIACLLTLTITVYNYSLSLSIQSAQNYNEFTRKYAKELANGITGGISATLIICLSYVYRDIANRLTNFENHRTQRDHDNHLSFKIYLFEFVNYYGTLFYIAFLKGNISSPGKPRYLYAANALKIENCAPGGCMSEVTMQMLIIMSVKQLVPILKDVVRTLNLNRIKEEVKVQLLAPLVGFWARARRWSKMAKQNLDVFTENREQFVQDFELADPTEMYQEYVNNIIQLGFLTMFVTAFPLAPLISLLINVWQIRQDATRYVKRVKRPIGFRCEGIGTWMNILETLSRIAILVNAILIAFTFDWLPQIVYNRYYKDQVNQTQDYVDFMLASHSFNHTATNTTQVCRYWSYIQPARSDHTRFWMELMLARMLFIFCFQNLVWAAVRIIELICDSTPKFVKERMALEERLAQEWLSSDEESDDEDEEEDLDNVSATLRKYTAEERPTDANGEDEVTSPLLRGLSKNPSSPMT